MPDATTARSNRRDISLGVFALIYAGLTASDFLKVRGENERLQILAPLLMAALLFYPAVKSWFNGSKVGEVTAKLLSKAHALSISDKCVGVLSLAAFMYSSGKLTYAMTFGVQVPFLHLLVMLACGIAGLRLQAVIGFWGLRIGFPD